MTESREPPDALTETGASIGIAAASAKLVLSRIGSALADSGGSDAAEPPGPATLPEEPWGDVPATQVRASTAAAAVVRRA